MLENEHLIQQDYRTLIKTEINLEQQQRIFSPKIKNAIKYKESWKKYFILKESWKKYFILIESWKKYFILIEFYKFSFQGV